MGTVASRTRRLSACHTASNPRASAWRTYSMAWRMGCLSWRYSATRPSLATAISAGSGWNERMLGDRFRPVPQPVGGDPASRGELLGVHPGQVPVQDAPLTADHDVSDVPRGQPEHPVAGEVALVERGGRVVLQHDQVGRSAGLDGAQERLVECLAGDAGGPGQ